MKLNRKQRRTLSSKARSQGVTLTMPNESRDQLVAKYQELAELVINTGLTETAAKLQLLDVSRKLQEIDAIAKGEPNAIQAAQDQTSPEPK